MPLFHRSRRAIVAPALIACAVAATVSAMQPASATPYNGSGCPQVEGIAVRASGEPQGGGSIAGPLVAAVQTQSTQSVREYDLVYPATLQNYQRSEQQGVTALQSRLSTLASSCASTKVFLVGYSQGAQVIADTLDAEPVSDAGQIKAAVLHGDPSFNGSESYDTGGYTRGRNGIFPRRAGALSAFASQLRSVCHVNDNFCQSGTYGNGHYTYANDRSAGVSFVLGKIGS